MNKVTILIGILVFIIFLIIATLLFLNRTRVEPIPGTESSRVISSLPPNISKAQTQTYANKNQPEKGNLVIDSNVARVEVTIDEKEVTEEEFFAPKNYTPFVAENLPVGSHTIRARKEGYLNQAQQVTVEANKIKKVLLELKPNPEEANLRAAKAQMPVDTPEYHIDYFDKLGLVQVIIKKEPFQTNKQLVLQWFRDRGVMNPEATTVVIYPGLYVRE